MKRTDRRIVEVVVYAVWASLCEFLIDSVHGDSSRRTDGRAEWSAPGGRRRRPASPDACRSGPSRPVPSRAVPLGLVTRSFLRSSVGSLVRSFMLLALIRFPIIHSHTT